MKKASPLLCSLSLFFLAGEARSENISALRASEEMGKGTIANDGESLTLRLGGKDVLSFRYAVMPAPEGKSERFARGGFIHPLRTPSGEVLTTIQPADHIHHYGIWNPWTSTTYDGQKVDYWNLGSGEGTLRFVKFEDQQEDATGAKFSALLDFVNLKAPGGEKVTLHERQIVRTELLPKEFPKGFFTRFTSEQWCATDKPFKIIKYRYGGFAFRARTDWNKTNSDYLTDLGKTRLDSHTTRARWCRIQGEVGEGKRAGVLFLSHPENYNHPEPLRTWTPKDHHGMIYFNFAGTQNLDWTLEPGKTYTRKYGIFAYDGEITAEQAEAIWRFFAGK